MLNWRYHEGNLSAIFTANRSACVISTKSNKTSAFTYNVVGQLWFKTSTPQAVENIKSCKKIGVLGGGVDSTFVTFSGEVWFQLSAHFNSQNK
jgi:hypothetical protein